MKMTKGMAVVLSVCLLLQTMGGDQKGTAKAAVTQLPMAEYYQQVMVEGKEGIDVAGKVIISSWQDFLQFRECLTRKKATAGVRFVQEADIKVSDASFSYDENSDITAIYRDGMLVGAITRAKRICKPLSVNEGISLSSIGLGDAYISNGAEDTKFYGTYDGGGHSISGIIFESLSQFDSGLFGWIYEQGTVQNVNVQNCCMMYAYAVISGYNLGRIENCTVTDTVGFGFSFGGIAGINDGIIQNCKVSGCEFMRGSLSGDLYGGIGGIVSCMILGTAKSCDVLDTTLRGFEELPSILGGITGTQESNTPLEKGVSCIDCISGATLIGGYSMGGICGSMPDDWVVSHINAAYLKNCLFKGIIREGGQDVSYAGGIIGKVESDSEIYLAECTNQGMIYRLGKKNRYSGAIGGILGEATGDAVIFACTNKGKILEDEAENTREGQVTYVGGLVGEANRQLRIINSNSEGDIRLSLSHSGDWTGGLIGKMSDNTRQYIANSCNSGDLTSYQVAGIAALVEQKENDKNTGMMVENCLNSGGLQGVEIGGLAGSITSGGFLRCYTTHSESLMISDSGGTWKESESLSESQVAGMAEILSAGSRNMTAMKEYGYSETYDYAAWKEGDRGPVPKLEGEYSYPLLTTLNKGADSSASREEDPEPDETPTATPTITPTPPVDTKPQATAPSLSDSQEQKEEGISMASVKKFQIKNKTNKKVVLKWKKNKEAGGYMLYRSTNRKYGYKKIAQIPGSKGSYTDQKVKKGKTYYYQIQTIPGKGSKKKLSKPVQLKVKIPYLAQPVIKLSKGKLDNGTRYMQISLKKTDGKYTEVYLRQAGKAYVRAKLKNEKISYLKKRIRFSYQNGNKTYICKVRTYTYIKGKKQYSSFSKEKKIKL